MDGNGPSVNFDRNAGVTVRRLGGNLMTPYDWRDNSTNAGKDYRHANGPFLLEILGVPKEQWQAPGRRRRRVSRQQRAASARAAC